MGGVSIRLDGVRAMRRFLEQLDPETAQSVTAEVMARWAFATETEAAERQIVPGRGNAPPLAKQLSRRSGTLTNSIETDASSRPYRYYVGTNIRYAEVHETGGTVTQVVRSHRRQRAFGRIIPGGFTVPTFTRRVRFRKRPFLEPAAVKVLQERGKEFFLRALLRARRRAR